MSMKPVVSLDVYNALDLRVGTILSISDYADGMVQLELQFDGFTRHFSLAWESLRPDVHELLGKQAIAVLNIPGRTPEESGRLLEIGRAEQWMPILVVPEHPIPEGARIE
ncbi:hypothetical protein RIF24_09440 [Exiguobacterium acetylicum]|uniref:hypothetical protein n=1 Tax=Exiguobacterium acetylicum TaxID=41170 RepID=UPI0022738AEA|nr:hypothetical protein [Exiguobacterium sp. SL14]MCY1690869.1 hypothetical protein [Exiguobacterium sp. SL14]